MNYYDTNGINRMLNLDDVIANLNLEVLWKGSNRFIRCPEHKNRTGFEDGKIGNCIISEKGYHCFACGAHGRLIDLIRHINHCTEEDIMKAYQLDPELFIKCNDFNYFPITLDELKIIGLTRYCETEVPYDESPFKIKQEDDKNISRKFFPVKEKYPLFSSCIPEFSTEDNLEEYIENFYISTYKTRVDMAEAFNSSEEHDGILWMIQGKILEAYNSIKAGLERHVFSEHIELVAKIMLKDDLEKIINLAKRFNVLLPETQKENGTF